MSDDNVVPLRPGDRRNPDVVAALERVKAEEAAARLAAEREGSEPPPPPPSDDDVRQIETYSDRGNALRFVEAFGDGFRNVAELGWHHWDGIRWRRDTFGEPTWKAGELMEEGYRTELRAAGEKARSTKHFLRSQSSGRLAAMVSIAATHPQLRCEPKTLDADPWLLNTPTGTLDLASGDLHPHDRTQLITKVTSAGYDPDADCPTWYRFLDEVFSGDADLINWLQRAVGYSLTGFVDEQVLFFLHGSGANGKSTLTNVLAQLLGDYATVVEPDVMLSTPWGTAPTGIAELQGRRLVLTAEVNEGRKWDEATVKRLVSTDDIVARRLYRDYFTFHPSHKLWFSANHLPRVRGTDEGIWRRIQLVPFRRTFTPAERDPNLARTLAGELPGILTWAVVGATIWKERGLGTSPAITAATTAYRAAEDQIGRWLEDQLQVGEHLSIAATALRKNYESWCEANGEYAQRQRDVAAELQRRGFDTERTNAERRWKGIGLPAGF